MSRIRLVASDLDGTLFLGNGTRPTDEAYEMIRRLSERGVVFVAASGRQYENMRDIFDDPSIAYLCYNGGLCVYRGETVYTRFLDHALALEIVRAISEVPGCRAMVSVRGAELIPQDREFYAYMTGFVGAHTRMVDDLTVAPDGIFKVALYNARGEIDDAYWKARFGDRCSVMTSGSVWLDFVPRGMNKGVALSALIDKLGIAPDECLAFGDNENDRAMLELVGHPVTMRSSNPGVIALGEYTADTVEDALRREFGF